jgi:CheY-like chemotaxis protein
MTIAVPTILLVEDDDVDVIAVQRALAKGGITNPLVTVGDGSAALEILRSGTLPISRLVILLDLHMPRMGGIEFLVELRADEHLRSIPVIVLTTSASDRDRMDAHRLDVAGYLVKPLSTETLVATMAALESVWATQTLP